MKSLLTLLAASSLTADLTFLSTTTSLDPSTIALYHDQTPDTAGLLYESLKDHYPHFYLISSTLIATHIPLTSYTDTSLTFNTPDLTIIYTTQPIPLPDSPTLIISPTDSLCTDPSYISTTTTTPTSSLTTLSPRNLLAWHDFPDAPNFDPPNMDSHHELNDLNPLYTDSRRSSSDKKSDDNKSSSKTSVDVRAKADTEGNASASAGVKQTYETPSSTFSGEIRGSVSKDSQGGPVGQVEAIFKIEL